MTLTKSCECCNHEDRGTFGNILPQFRRKGRKYSLVEAIMASAYLARYELELKKKYPQEFWAKRGNLQKDDVRKIIMTFPIEKSTPKWCFFLLILLKM